MSEKQTVKFGDICREVKLTTKNPIADGYDKYIGLEHLDSRSLKIKRWGTLSDENISFTHVFKKGQILFGKRRPYLKKAAIAEFDGICSSDIVVIEPINNLLLPELLPYFIQTESFWNYAIKTSAGGLSPRTKFSSLVDYPFNISDIKNQKKILSLLNSAQITLNNLLDLTESLIRLRKTILENSIDIGRWASLFKVINRNGYPMITLDSIAKRGTGHTPSKSFPEYWDSNIKWVSLQDSKSLDNIYISDTAQKISKLGIMNSSAVIHPKNTVVVCRDASIGMATILGEDMAVSQHFIAWICSEALYPKFLYYWLIRLKPVMNAVAIGSTIKTIGMGFFEKLEIPLPDIKKQMQIADTLEKIDLQLIDLESQKISLVNLISAISSDLH